MRTVFRLRKNKFNFKTYIEGLNVVHRSNNFAKKVKLRKFECLTKLYEYEMGIQKKCEN